MEQLLVLLAAQVSQQAVLPVGLLEPLQVEEQVPLLVLVPVLVPVLVLVLRWVVQWNLAQALWDQAEAVERLQESQWAVDRKSAVPAEAYLVPRLPVLERLRAVE
jgi:hypothetical protein